MSEQFLRAAMDTADKWKAKAEEATAAAQKALAQRDATLRALAAATAKAERLEMLLCHVVRSTPPCPYADHPKREVHERHCSCARHMVSAALEGVENEPGPEIHGDGGGE